LAHHGGQRFAQAAAVVSRPETSAMSSAKTIASTASRYRKLTNSPQLQASSVAGALCVLIYSAITLYPVWFTIHYRGVYDPDIWWHMRAGEWVLQNHTVPRTNFLSTAGYGSPWVLYSWIFDVTVAGLYRVFGLLGPVIIYPVTMSLLIAAMLWRLTARFGLDFWKRVLVMSLSLAALAPVCSPRPGLCSVLFLLVELDVLVHSGRNHSSRTIYLLPFLFVLWANVHVQFVYGLFVLGLFALEPLMEPAVERLKGKPATERQPAGHGLFLLCICIVATLANPYFLRLYEVILGLVTQTGQYRYISELQPPTFRSLGGVAELLLILVAWAALVHRRNFCWIPICFLLVGSVFAFRTVRDVWFAVLAAVFAIGASSRQGDVESLRASRWISAAAVFLTLLGSLLIAKVHPLSQAQLWKDTADEFPVAAVNFVKSQRLSGPLYNDWNWGGFLIWDLPTIPVFVDSRTNIPGDEILERSIAVWSGVSDWPADPHVANAHLIIANSNNALTSLLRFDPRFRVAYEDSVAVVFVRSQA
jgi:hypothetical protein